MKYRFRPPTTSRPDGDDDQPAPRPYGDDDQSDEEGSLACGCFIIVLGVLIIIGIVVLLIGGVLYFTGWEWFGSDAPQQQWNYDHTDRHIDAY